jgi:epoxyqueuosine reductase QueG
VRACYRIASGFKENKGFDATICGMCIAACPWTMRYLQGKPHINTPLTD